MIQTRVEQVLAEFAEKLREAVIQDFVEQAGAGPVARTPVSSTPKAAVAPKPQAAKPPKRAKGAKRTPEEIEQLTKNLLAAIKKTPGQNIETLAKTIGAPTKDLALPVAKLWETKAIKTKGQRRGTKYFPA